MGSQVINAKGNNGPNAIQYGVLIPFDFDVVTLSSNQANTTVANAQPVGIAMKVIMFSVLMPVVNGSAGVSVNIVAGTGAETGLGPTDPLLTSGYPPTAAQMMANGNALWASDQALNGTSAPVANAVYNLYPVADAWDCIFPNTLPMTLRVVAGAGAASGTLKAVAYVVLVDIHPYQPNGANPFAPSATIL